MEPGPSKSGVNIGIEDLLRAASFAPDNLGHASENGNSVVWRKKDGLQMTWGQVEALIDQLKITGNNPTITENAMVAGPDLIRAVKDSSQYVVIQTKSGHSIQVETENRKSSGKLGPENEILEFRFATPWKPKSAETSVESHNSGATTDNQEDPFDWVADVTRPSGS